MKKIKNITPNGITYINELGEDNFIDFKKCNENWIQYRKRTENLNDETVEQIKKSDRYVGQRNICSDHKFIEFFTYPKFTRFEFQETAERQDSEKLFSNLKNSITLAGWTTLDLS
jgi:hypothetical protein